MVKATEDDTNTTPTRQLTAGALTALSGRLVSHADSIQNIAAQGMADDMRLAAQAIEHLMRPAAEDMPEAVKKGNAISPSSTRR